MGSIGITEIVLVLFGLLVIIGLPFTIIALSFSRRNKSIDAQSFHQQGEIVKVSELRELISHEVAGNMTTVETKLQELDERLQKIEASHRDNR